MRTPQRYAPNGSAATGVEQTAQNTPHSTQAPNLLGIVDRFFQANGLTQPVADLSENLYYYLTWAHKEADEVPQLAFENHLFSSLETIQLMTSLYKAWASEPMKKRGETAQPTADAVGQVGLPSICQDEALDLSTPLGLKARLTEVFSVFYSSQQYRDSQSADLYTQLHAALHRLIDDSATAESATMAEKGGLSRV